MVDVSALEKLELYRDPTSGRFIARDPSDGSTFEVPFESLEVSGNATVQGDATVGGSLNADAVDHDNTTNRTHQGDDLSPNSVDASSVSTGQVTDSGGTPILGASVASGSVTLASGTATIDTGVGVGTTATFYVALGPDTDDADVAADIRAASGGNYEVDIQETDSSVGNPTINYDIVRVR